MYQPKHWNLIEPRAQAAEELAARLQTSPLIAQMLLNRGLTETADCQTFLKPTLKLLHDPDTIPNLSIAAERIARAIRDKEKIVVYGDYDVDGITATSILWHAIRVLGGTVDYYIPHRIDEGYGLNEQAITQICDDGAKLIVTVDCGVTAHASAAVARARGVELIITDHHEWQGDVPDCFAVVHPRLPQAIPYPNANLCGAGVAFKLAWATGTAIAGNPRVSEAFREFLLNATALAALGTIADVVPLVGENRVLAHCGLGGLKVSKLTGIRALIETASLCGQTLDAYHVGFLLAPRLNAAGRMGHARLAVEMMTTADQARAAEIAVYLEEQNRDRQALEKKILDQAIEQAEQLKCGEDSCRGIVLGNVGWHPGVIGIVASRIVERYHKPAVMVALGEELGQGSCRSINGFHIAQALNACHEHLVHHGGHEMAAGLRVKQENFEPFRQAFAEYAFNTITRAQLVRELKLEVEAELRQLTEPLVHELKRLGPFGQGNRRPVLCVKGVELVSPPRRVGKSGDHLQLYVRQGKTAMKCIAFNSASLFDKLRPGTAIDLAAEPQLNEWKGTISVELQVRDLQVGGRV